MSEAIFRLAVQWTAFMLLWLLFVFQFRGSEAIAGAAASALCVLGIQTATRAVPFCFQPRTRWLAQGFRLPGMIAADLTIMCRDLVERMFRSPSHGVWRQTSFRTEDDCRGAARRTLAILLLTTTPNSVVVDADESRLLLHELVSAPLPELVRKLQE